MPSLAAAERQQSYLHPEQDTAVRHGARTPRYPPQAASGSGGNVVSTSERNPGPKTLAAQSTWALRQVGSKSG